jgi:hypothetical protein
MFLENMPRKFQVHENLIGITGTLHEDQYKLTIISRSIPLRMRNVLDKFIDRIKHTFYTQ